MGVAAVYARCECAGRIMTWRVTTASDSSDESIMAQIYYTSLNQIRNQTLIGGPTPWLVAWIIGQLSSWWMKNPSRMINLSDITTKLPTLLSNIAGHMRQPGSYSPRSGFPEIAYLPMLFILLLTHIASCAGQLKNNRIDK